MPSVIEEATGAEGVRDDEIVRNDAVIPGNAMELVPLVPGPPPFRLSRQQYGALGFLNGARSASLSVADNTPRARPSRPSSSSDEST